MISLSSLPFDYFFKIGGLQLNVFSFCENKDCILTVWKSVIAFCLILREVQTIIYTMAEAENLIHVVEKYYIE